MKNISQYLMYVLLVVGTVVFLMSTLGDSHNALIYYNYVLFGLAVLVTLYGSVTASLANPTKLKGSLIGIGGLALILAISYGLASDSVPTQFADDVSASTSKLCGMGLYAFYILFVGAIGSIVFSGVTKMLK